MKQLNVYEYILKYETYCVSIEDKKQNKKCRKVCIFPHYTAQKIRKKQQWLTSEASRRVHERRSFLCEGYSGGKLAKQMFLMFLLLNEWIVHRVHNMLRE